MGGPSSLIRNIIFSLGRDKYDLFLITLFDESTSEVIDEVKNTGVKVIECNFKGRANTILFGQKKFNSVIDQNHITVIHSHGFIPDILSARVKNDHIKKISTIHNNPFFEYPEVYGKIKSFFFLKIQKYDIIANKEVVGYDQIIRS